MINGDGMQTRDFVYVGDVVRANCLALSNNDEGVFNIGTGRGEVHIKKLFKELVNIVGVNIGEGYGPPKSGEQKRSVIDFEKAKKALGWSPQVFLEAGLKNTVDYFKGAGSNETSMSLWLTNENENPPVSPFSKGGLFFSKEGLGEI